MKTKFYHYPRHIQAVKIGAWLMTVLILAFVALAVFAVLSNPLALIESPLETLQIFLGLLIGAAITIYGANYYPTIGVDEHGILVKFLWHYFKIPWEQVIGIKRRPTILLESASFWLVRTSRLTLFHRLYGFPHPGFFIHASMNNYKELIEEIERHVKENTEATRDRSLSS
jgi:hypothetical protein